MCNRGVWRWGRVRKRGKKREREKERLRKKIFLAVLKHTTWIVQHNLTLLKPKIFCLLLYGSILDFVTRVAGRKIKGGGKRFNFIHPLVKRREMWLIESVGRCHRKLAY